MSQNTYIWIAIFVMWGVSYLLRVLPITLIRKPIQNRFIRSVLYYLPYVTLSVMTVPAIFSISENPICGLGALIGAILVSWFTSNLFLSATAACVVTYVLSILL